MRGASVQLIEWLELEGAEMSSSLNGTMRAAVISTTLIFGGCQTAGITAEALKWAADVAKAVDAACHVLPSISQLAVLFGSLEGKSLAEIVALVCGNANQEKARVLGLQTHAKPAVAAARARLPVGSDITFTVNGKRISARVTQ